jgi:hypothetical protein
MRRDFSKQIGLRRRRRNYARSRARREEKCA